MPLAEPAPITSRSITISATRLFAAASWPGNGTSHGSRVARLASMDNSTSCARRSPTAAMCRASRRCGSAAAPIGATTAGSPVRPLHAFAQNDVSQFDTTTGGYDLLKVQAREPAVLEGFAVGRGRSRDRTGWRQSAQRQYPQCRSIPQGRDPAARPRLQTLSQRQIRRRPAERSARSSFGMGGCRRRRIHKSAADA